MYFEILKSLFKVLKQRGNKVLTKAILATLRIVASRVSIFDYIYTLISNPKSKRIQQLSKGPLRNQFIF